MTIIPATIYTPTPSTLRHCHSRHSFILVYFFLNPLLQRFLSLAPTVNKLTFLHHYRLIFSTSGKTTSVVIHTIVTFTIILILLSYYLKKLFNPQLIFFNTHVEYVLIEYFIHNTSCLSWSINILI